MTETIESDLCRWCGEPRSKPAERFAENSCWAQHRMPACDWCGAEMTKEELDNLTRHAPTTPVAEYQAAMFARMDLVDAGTREEDLPPEPARPKDPPRLMRTCEKCRGTGQQ